MTEEKVFLRDAANRLTYVIIEQGMAPGVPYSTYYGMGNDAEKPLEDALMYVCVGKQHKSFDGTEEIKRCKKLQPNFAENENIYSRPVGPYSLYENNVTRIPFIHPLTKYRKDYYPPGIFAQTRITAVENGAVELTYKKPGCVNGEFVFHHIYMSEHKVRSSLTLYKIRRLVVEDSLEIAEKFPDLIAWVMCESLGYFSVKAALNALNAYFNKESFCCEWYQSIGSDAECWVFDSSNMKRVNDNVIESAVRNRNCYGKTMMDNIDEAKRQVSEYVKGRRVPELAAWF